MKGTRTTALAAGLLLTVALPVAAQDPWMNARGTDIQAGRAVFIQADGFFGLDSYTPLTLELDPNRDEMLSAGSGGGNFQVQFRDERERVSIQATGMASARYFPQFIDSLGQGYSASARVGSSGSGPRRRLSWSVLQDLSYAPGSTLYFLPNSGAAANIESLPAVDYQFSDDYQVISSTGGDVTYGFTRSASLTVSGLYGVSNGSSEALGDYQRANAGATFTQRVSRFASWRAGYSYWQSRGERNSIAVAPGELGLVAEVVTPTVPDPVERTRRPQMHNIDTGVSYNRPLPFARRTEVSLSVGGTALTSLDDDLHYTAVGEAGVTHRFGRNWTLRAAYSRGANFAPSFLEPLLSHTLIADFGGRLTRRSGASVNASWSRGTIGVGADSGGNGFDTSLVSAQYRLGLTRNLSAQAQYFFFGSSFGGRVILPDEISRDQRRHGLRVGLSLGLDVYRGQ